MPTIRENVVILKSADIASVSYIENSAVVSSGQPMETPPIIKHSEDIVSILFKAGRHKTADVANRFRTVTGGNGHEYAPQGGSGGTPKELNFFFGLNVTWRGGAESRIYLGQGSNLTHNNWWIGSPSISNDGSTASITVDSARLKISGASVEDDLRQYAGMADGIVPPKFQPLLQLIGKPLFQEMVRQVNLFKFSK